MCIVVIAFLLHHVDIFIVMCILCFLQTLIKTQWMGLMWEERGQLKSTLYQYALDNQDSSQKFIRNKLVKLVVLIARLDWPHFYPDFFTNILQVNEYS